MSLLLIIALLFFYFFWSKLAIRRVFWRQFSRELVNASSWLDSGFLAGLFPPSFFFLREFSTSVFAGPPGKTISDSISRSVLWLWTTGLTCLLPPFVCGSARESEAVSKRHSSDARAKINCISCTFAPMAFALFTWHLHITWYSFWRHDRVLKLGSYESQKLL